MSDDKSIEVAKGAWQAQRVEAPPMHYLRMRALEHAQAGRNRSLLEYFGAAAAIVTCVWLAAAAESTLLRVGSLVLLVGALYGLYEWRRRRLVWSLTLQGTADNAVTFYKQELTRLRDMHRGLWKAHLIASVPGASILLAWVFLEFPGPDNWWHGIWSTCAVAVWIGWFLWYESENAKRYQRELDVLEQAEPTS